MGSPVGGPVVRAVTVGDLIAAAEEHVAELARQLAEIFDINTSIVLCVSVHARLCVC